MYDLFCEYLPESDRLSSKMVAVLQWNKQIPWSYTALQCHQTMTVFIVLIEIPLVAQISHHVYQIKFCTVENVWFLLFRVNENIQFKNICTISMYFLVSSNLWIKFLDFSSVKFTSQNSMKELQMCTNALKHISSETKHLDKKTFEKKLT